MLKAIALSLALAAAGFSLMSTMSVPAVADGGNSVGVGRPSP